MNSTITTTIRWNKEELEDVKRCARLIGLPTSLFLKSVVLGKIRNQKEEYPQTLKKIILNALEEVNQGEVDIFKSKKELLKDLKSNMNDN